MADSRDQPVPASGDEPAESKTQQKKRMLALQALGESLIDLPAAQYKSLPLPGELRDAVDAARAMNKRGALHRQRQFIGRVMRQIDAAPIVAALERLQAPDRAAARDFHRLEALRTRLLDEHDEDAFAATCAAFPAIDRQRLRHKLRAARAEASSGRPAGGQRALFRFLSEALQAQQAEAKD